MRVTLASIDTISVGATGTASRCRTCRVVPGSGASNGWIHGSDERCVEVVLAEHGLYRHRELDCIEPGRHLHHQMMNAALAEVVDGLANASICDVRDFVHTVDDLMLDIRHYRGHVYLAIAEGLRAGGASELTLQRDGVLSRGYLRTGRFAGRRKVQLHRLATGKGREPSDRTQ